MIIVSAAVLISEGLLGLLKLGYLGLFFLGGGGGLIEVLKFFLVGLFYLGGGGIAFYIKSIVVIGLGLVLHSSGEIFLVLLGVELVAVFRWQVGEDGLGELEGVLGLFLRGVVLVESFFYIGEEFVFVKVVLGLGAAGESLGGFEE